MMEIKKVLITVKTYPTISKKYDELVCTAGVMEDGSWIRIYPMPFRKLEYEKQYNKYQWLEAPFEKNESDVRPESYKIVDRTKIKLLHVIGTQDDWSERRNMLLNKQYVHTNLKNLICRAHKNELSLAIFKPARIIDFIHEPAERDWPKDKMDILNAKSMQLSLFQTPEEIEKEFSVVRKLPYRFSYKFVDDEGTESTLMVEDWELGMLYWNCLARYKDNEEISINKVKQKYYDEFSKKDLYFFLGTLKQFHGWAKNPFVIVGVFYPPVKQQTDLF